MRVIGKGNTAEVIEIDSKRVCKLFFEGYPHIAIEREYNNAKIVESMEIPCPKAYEIVNRDGRSGIVYERLYGKSLLDKLIVDNNVADLIGKFVALHKKILRCHTSSTISYKDFLRSCIDSKDEIYGLINDLPEGNFLCHGDYHPDNVLIDTGGNTIVIDFMNVCYGPWQYDVARTFCLIAREDVPQDMKYREKIIMMQAKLGEMYLKEMNVSYEEIEKYIIVIDKCRKFEMHRV